MRLAFLILLFSVGLMAQNTIPSANPTITDLQTRVKTEKIKDVDVHYDKFKDKSVVATKPQNLVGSWEGGLAIVATGMAGPNKAQTFLFLQIGYEFKGQVLGSTPDHYAVIFRSSSSDWNFLKGDRNLYILFDEERLELHPLASDSDILLSPISKGVSVAESLGFAITRNDLERVLKAKKAEFKLGDTKPREWKADWSKRIQAVMSLTTVP